MHAIEFEAVASQRMPPVPEIVPEGVPLRILALVDESISIPPESATTGKAPAGTITQVSRLGSYARCGYRSSRPK